MYAKIRIISIILGFFSFAVSVIGLFFVDYLDLNGWGYASRKYGYDTYFVGGPSDARKEAAINEFVVMKERIRLSKQESEIAQKEEYFSVLEIQSRYPEIVVLNHKSDYWYNLGPFFLHKSKISPFTQTLWGFVALAFLIYKFVISRIYAQSKMQTIVKGQSMIPITLLYSNFYILPTLASVGYIEASHTDGFVAFGVMALYGAFLAFYLIGTVFFYYISKKL